MKKRILMLASRPLADDGLTKIEMDIYRMYKNQADFEFACAFGFDNVYGAELKRDDVPLYKLPSKKNVFSYMIAIKKLVRTHKYDVVYIHGNSAMMAFDSIPAKYGGAKKVVTHCHNTRSDYPLLHLLMKPAFNRSVDVKIAVSSFAADFTYYDPGIVIIPNGIDTNRMKYNEFARKRIRKDLDIGDAILVGHVGRFSRQKNHGRLLSIFEMFNKVEPHSKLLLIGDGTERQIIRERVQQDGIKDRVIFVDHTDKVEDYLSAMDVMVIPSLFEGLCLVALEAQANGLPLIIDDKFSPETSIVRQMKIVGLTEDDSIWAESMQEAVNEGRYKPSSDEIKRMDWSKMMNTIYDIIINPSGGAKRIVDIRFIAATQGREVA